MEPPHFNEDDIPGLIKIEDSPPPPSLPELSANELLEPLPMGGGHSSSSGGNLLDPEYRDVQLDYIPEIDVFYILFDRCHAKNRKRSI